MTTELSLGHYTRLVVDLGAVERNYLRLRALSPNAETAAVLKADAYGAGATPVARKLVQAGCRTIFVATAHEARDLRQALVNWTGEIFVLNGFSREQADLFKAHRLGAVLSSLNQVSDFLEVTEGPFAVQVDTGMNRLGLSLEACAELLTQDINPRFVMSHLACSEVADSPMNSEQLDRFAALMKPYPHLRASLANTGGIFLGSPFHFNLTRPGIGLLGATADPEAPHSLEPAVTLDAPILQVRTVRQGDTVGYGASFTVPHDMRVAIAAAGYADGIPRALSNKGFGRIEGLKAPILGRVSMDLVALDVTGIEDCAQVGSPVKFFGADLGALAKLAGTLPYELLTGVGQRVSRVHVEGI